MDNIVYIENGIKQQEPFTTSDIIAEHTGIEHRKLKTVIRNHLKEFEELGISTRYGDEIIITKKGISMFQILKSKGAGRPEMVFRLNEPQATFLITLLKNTPIVVEFKQELVRQFFLMRSELIKRRQIRTEFKPIRRELTDSIKNRTDLKEWSYKTFTDLVYKCAINKTAAQIRNERGKDGKATALDLLSSDELENVSRISNQIAVLIDLGMNYADIKTIIKKKHTCG